MNQQITFKDEVASILDSQPYRLWEFNEKHYNSAYLWSSEPFSPTDKMAIKNVLGAESVREWTNNIDGNEHRFGIAFGGVKYDKRFHRKVWSATYNRSREDFVAHLRTVGRSRLNAYLGGITNHRSKTMKHQSTAMWNLGLKKGARGVFVDLGAGESADRVIARDFGYIAVGYDLFPINNRLMTHRVEPLTICDIAEHIPQLDSSVDVAVCQAVTDLIEPEARAGFYREVYRILKAGGRLSIQFTKLRNGWGYNQFDECLAIQAVGFAIEKSYQTGYVFVKKGEPTQ